MLRSQNTQREDQQPYDEGRWVTLDDSRRADIEPTLTLLEALHARWVGLLRAMSNYAWHGRHHTAQILGCAGTGWV